jgi:hypothetical protein
MDLRDFENGIDRRRDLDEITVASQAVDKGADIGKHAGD